MSARLLVAATDEESHKLFTESGALLTGHFRLTSGRHSDKYFQCATLLEQPAAAEKIAGAVAEIVKKWQPEVVVAPALGAIVFGYELARQLGVRSLFAERPEGKFELRRGFQLKPGERVLLAENVVTTGGSVIETAELVRSLGGNVVGYAVIVDRSGGRFSPAEPAVAYATMSAETWTEDECGLCASGLPITKPGSRSFT